MRFYANKEEFEYMTFDDGTKMFYFSEMSQADDEYVHGIERKLDTERLIQRMVDRFETEDGERLDVNIEDCKNWKNELYNQIVSELVSHYYPKVWELVKRKLIDSSTSSEATANKSHSGQ